MSGRNVLLYYQVVSYNDLITKGKKNRFPRSVSDGFIIIKRRRQRAENYLSRKADSFKEIIIIMPLTADIVLLAT